MESLKIGPVKQSKYPQLSGGCVFPVYSISDSDKCISIKIYTKAISGLHEFPKNSNNTIVLIHE